MAFVAQTARSGRVLDPSSRVARRRSSPSPLDADPEPILPWEPAVASSGLPGPRVPAMTTHELARGIAEETRLTQLRTKGLLRRTRDAILWSVVLAGRIELRKFGVSLGVTPPEIGLVTDLDAQVVEPARLADDVAREPAGIDHHVGKVRRRERGHRPPCRPTRRRAARARRFDRRSIAT